MLTVIKYASCPYCGSIHPVLTLGLLTSKVDPHPTIRRFGREMPNPRFKATHLTNPIRCPECNREYYIAVGVEAGYFPEEIRRVHVEILRGDDEITRELVNWPHMGLVDPMVIEYMRRRAYIYEDIDHYEEYNPGLLEAAFADNTDTVQVPREPSTPVSSTRPPPREILLDRGWGRYISMLRRRPHGLRRVV
ncbi:MAG: hypothetical protein GSR73_04765 [Desulfurococcales archaeon]|nr:hypothetical protein [Desulfurococcales archaeon]